MDAVKVIKAKLTTISPIVKGLNPCYILGANNKAEFLIGRHVDADCLIKDVTVSRSQAVIKYDESTSRWTVHDQGAQTWILVNGKRVPPKGSFVLSHGDKIAIGDYRWSFRFPRNDVAVPGPSINQGVSRLKSLTVAKVSEGVAGIAAVEKKIKEVEDSRRSVATERDNLLTQLKLENDKFVADQKAEREKFEKKLAETKKEIAEAERKQFEKKLKEDAEQMEKKQLKIKKKLKKVTDRLEEAVKQRDEWMAENEKLKEEAAKAKEEEAKQRERIEEELNAKRDEISKLNQALEDQKKRHETFGVSARKKLKSDIMSHCNNEFKCPICDELFIDPVGLDCGHVYCDFCINQWKSRCKTDFTCPNCRQKVVNVTKSLHIKNLIDAIYDGAEPELKAEREQVVKERREEADALPKKTTKASKENLNFLARPAARGTRPAGARQNRVILPAAPRVLATTNIQVARIPAPAQNVVRVANAGSGVRSVARVANVGAQARNVVRAHNAGSRAATNQVPQRPPSSTVAAIASLVPQLAGRRLVPVRFPNPSSNAVVVNRQTVPVINLE